MGNIFGVKSVSGKWKTRTGDAEAKKLIATVKEESALGSEPQEPKVSNRHASNRAGKADKKMFNISFQNYLCEIISRLQ